VVVRKASRVAISAVARTADRQGRFRIPVHNLEASLITEALGPCLLLVPASGCAWFWLATGVITG